MGRHPRCTTTGGGETCTRQHTSAYGSIRQHTSAYVSIRQHTPAYVSIRQHTAAYVSICQHMSAYVSIRQHTSAYVSIPQHTSAYDRIRQHTSAYVSIRQHTSAYVSGRQHTSAYASIRQHTSAYVSIRQHTSADVSIHDYGGRRNQHALRHVEKCEAVVEPHLAREPAQLRVVVEVEVCEVREGRDVLAAQPLQRVPCSSIRTIRYVIRQNTWVYVSIRQLRSAYVSRNI
jgi:hypothetical protein